MTSSILLVCANPLTSRAIETQIRSAGFSLLSFASGIEAVSCFGAGRPALACLISDTSSFGISGWDLARIARQSNNRIGVIYLGSGDVGGWLVQGVPESTMLAAGWQAAHLPELIVSAVHRVSTAAADRFGRPA